MLEVYCRTEQNFIGNPNSTHCAGQAARQEMNRVTGLIAAQLGVLPGGNHLYIRRNRSQ